MHLPVLPSSAVTVSLRCVLLVAHSDLLVQFAAQVKLSMPSTCQTSLHCLRLRSVAAGLLDQSKLRCCLFVEKLLPPNAGGVTSRHDPYATTEIEPLKSCTCLCCVHVRSLFHSAVSFWSHTTCSSGEALDGIYLPAKVFATRAPDASTTQSNAVTSYLLQSTFSKVCSAETSTRWVDGSRSLK